MRGEKCKIEGCGRVSVPRSSYCGHHKYKLNRENKSILKDLEFGKPGKVEKYDPKRRAPLLTDEEQRAIDISCVQSHLKKFPLDPPRSLSKEEIEELENRGLITPVDWIPYSKKRFAPVKIIF